MLKSCITPKIDVVPFHSITKQNIKIKKKAALNGGLTGFVPGGGGPLRCGGGRFIPTPLRLPDDTGPNYENMVTSLKIFIYTPTSTSTSFDFPAGAASLFYNSLVRSRFVTQNPDEAHLFFLPFSPDTSTRSLARLVRQVRNKYPYWNRTLGADHFFVPPNGIDYSSDRNILELKKNSLQISLISAPHFIPHKDITLPPPPLSPLFITTSSLSPNSTLAHLKWDGKTDPNLVNDLKLDPDFLVEQKSSRSSKFCLFLHRGLEGGIVESMASGCVPVVIVDRPIQDLPLMDILRWSEIGLFVGRAGAGAGAGRLKQLLLAVSEEKYAVMRDFGVVGSKHLMWNDQPQPLDAFHMVIYQLWLRRHAVRYARRT